MSTVSITLFCLEELMGILGIQFYKEVFPTINHKLTSKLRSIRVSSSLIATANRRGHQVVQLSHF